MAINQSSRSKAPAGMIWFDSSTSSWNLFVIKAKGSALLKIGGKSLVKLDGLTEVRRTLAKIVPKASIKRLKPFQCDRYLIHAPL
jgi:hypothetical protein